MQWWQNCLSEKAHTTAETMDTAVEYAVLEELKEFNADRDTLSDLHRLVGKTLHLFSLEGNETDKLRRCLDLLGHLTDMQNIWDFFDRRSFHCEEDGKLSSLQDELESSIHGTASSKQKNILELFGSCSIHVARCMKLKSIRRLRDVVPFLLKVLPSEPLDSETKWNHFKRCIAKVNASMEIVEEGLHQNQDGLGSAIHFYLSVRDASHMWFYDLAKGDVCFGAVSNGSTELEVQSPQFTKEMESFLLFFLRAQDMVSESVTMEEVREFLLVMQEHRMALHDLIALQRAGVPQLCKGGGQQFVMLSTKPSRSGAPHSNQSGDQGGCARVEPALECFPWNCV